MKPILALLFVVLSSNSVQAGSSTTNTCSLLEDSDLSHNIDLRSGNDPSFDLYMSIAPKSNFAFSSDQKKLATYQFFESKQQAIFKLFDSKTGKLLQSKTLNNYVERSYQTRLHFSPKDSIVYLEGMSYLTKDDSGYGAIPFWNLANNQIIFSPCSTAMGVFDVQFSDDENVAFSKTVDSHSSLCSTQEEKALALIGQNGDYLFNPKTKHLYSTYATTNDKRYESLVKDLGEDIKHVSLYKSPVPEHPYRSDSRNTFASLMLGTAPNLRQLIAKSEGDSLSLSYWDHTVQQNPPKKIYQHKFTIAELDSGEIIVPFIHSRLSQDEKSLAFISKTGVMLIFNVETGELLWKKNLPAPVNNDKLRYSREDNLLAEHGASTTAIVISKNEPKTLYLFDWKSGKQRQLNIPDTYYSYKQYGQYLVFEANEYKPNKPRALLLVNWQTGQQQIVNLPNGFDYYASEQRFIANNQQLVIENTNNADTVLVLNLSSGKYQTLKAPFPDKRYYSSQYFRLGDKYHRILTTKKSNKDGKEQTSIQLYDVEKKQVQSLQTAEMFFYQSLVEPAGESPEYHTISYDEKAKQTMFCRLPLAQLK